MSNFIVSARKYRPDHFSSVVGQQHITQTLKTAIKNNQIAQAFLFCGPRGVGKTSCARILAKTLNCTQRTSEYEACDVCESCLSFIAGTSFNVHELDAASNNTVEDIRGLVEQVRYPPQAGKYKIYIIDEVHMLSTSAFNAFLKTLEEPPPYAIFILATTEKHKIIPTILSRCQIFDFHRIQVKDIASHLAHIAKAEGIEFEPDAMHIIAQKADGALRDALSAFDQLSIFTDNHITYRAVIENLNILDYDYYFKVTDKLIEEDITGVLLLFDDIIRNGFNGNDFINGLNSHFRDLLVSKDVQTLPLLETSEQAKVKYAQQSSLCSPSFLLSAMVIGNQAELNYRGSKNPRLQIELALMKMCHILSAFKIKSPPPDSNPGYEKKNSNPVNNKGFAIAVESSEIVGDLILPLTNVPILIPNTRVQPDSVQPGLVQLASVQPGSVQPASVEQSSGQPALVLPASVEPSSGQPALVLPALVLSSSGESKGVLEVEIPSVLIQTKENALRSPVKIRLPKTSDLGKHTEEKKENDFKQLLVEEEDNHNLDPADVIRVWKEYTHLINDGSKVNIHNLISAYDPRIEDGKVIIAFAENLIQRDMLHEEIPTLQKFMKEKLQHRSISFRIEVIEQIGKKSKSLFSAHDRFMHLAEKNPHLLEFKNRLDLDLDR